MPAASREKSSANNRAFISASAFNQLIIYVRKLALEFALRFAEPVDRLADVGNDF